MALLLAGARIACRCRRPKNSTQIGRLNVLLGCFVGHFVEYSALTEVRLNLLFFLQVNENLQSLDEVQAFWEGSLELDGMMWNPCEISANLGKNHFEEQIHLKTFVYQHRFPVLHAARVSRLKCCMVFLEDWRQSDDLCFAFQRLFTFIYVLLSCQCVGNVGQQDCGEKGDGLKWRKRIDHVNYVWRLVSQTSKTQLAWCSTTPHRFLYLRLIHWYYLTLQGTCAIWAYPWPDSGNGWLFTWICP